MTPADTLRAARARIPSEGAWSKGLLARSAEGAPVFPTSSRAARWCAEGALDTVGAAVFGPAWVFLTEAAKARGFPSIVALNDALTTTHADVLALYDDAIARAEAAETLAPGASP